MLMYIVKILLILLGNLIKHMGQIYVTLKITDNWQEALLHHILH